MADHEDSVSNHGREAGVEVAIGGYIVNLTTPSKKTMDYSPPKQAVAKTLEEALKLVKDHLE